MTAMQVAKQMTADEFLALPETPGQRWNLVDGEVVVTDPSLKHQRTVQRINRALDRWAYDGDGGGEVVPPINVHVDDANNFAPDLLWYAECRAPTPQAKRPYAMPDLAIEVRSKTTWRHDLGAKRAGYERAGLPELWLVDTKNRLILVFRRSSPGAAQFDIALELSGDEQLTSPQLPGFELPVATVFAEP